MWLEWISDEARVAMSEEELDAIAKLYERALADYSTVNRKYTKGVWCDLDVA